MDINALQPGMVVTFLYPAHNFVGVKSGMERRQLLIERVRELEAEPLVAFTSENQPLLKRGETLVIGQDLEKRAERSFYWESMQDVRPLAESDIVPEEPHVVTVAGEEVFRGPGPVAANWAKDWLKERTGERVSIEAA